MTSYEPNKPLYRSRDGLILGVCRGVADHMNFSVFWTRIIALTLLLCTGVWPVLGLYFLAAVLMKLEPVLPVTNDQDREFYNSYVSSRGMALQRLKRTFEGLDRRVQRMEHIVTSREYDWEQRMNSYRAQRTGSAAARESDWERRLNS